MLTVRSGLGDIYIKDDDSCVLNMLIIYYLMLYIIYVTLIMRLWELYNLVAIFVEFDMDSLLLFPPNLRTSLGLWSTSQLDPVEWSSYPKLELSIRCLLLKVISFILSKLYIYALSLHITSYL